MNNQYNSSKKNKNKKAQSEAVLCRRLYLQKTNLEKNKKLIFFGNLHNTLNALLFNNSYETQKLYLMSYLDINLEELLL
jgi:hypothetical protein